MLVRLADWCYRQAPSRRRRSGSPRWWARSPWPARSAGSSGRTTCSRGRSPRPPRTRCSTSFPQRAGRHRPDRGPLRRRRLLARGAGRGPSRSSPTSPTSDHVVGVASPFTDGGRRPDLRGRHDRVRRRRPRPRATTSSRAARGQGAGRTDPRRRRRHPAGRGRRPGRRAVPDGAGRHPRASGSSPPPSSCCSPSARRSRWACRCSPRCSASASRWRSARSCVAWSTSRTGRPPTAAMVGIGVGIDYALLIVTRFRSSLAEGQEPRRATLTRDRDRRPRRAVRRPHRGRLDARHPADGPAGHERVRLHRGRSPCWSSWPPR